MRFNLPVFNAQDPQSVSRFVSELNRTLNEIVDRMVPSFHQSGLVTRPDPSKDVSLPVAVETVIDSVMPAGKNYLIIAKGSYFDTSASGCFLRIRENTPTGPVLDEMKAENVANDRVAFTVQHLSERPAERVFLTATTGAGASTSALIKDAKINLVTFP